MIDPRVLPILQPIIERLERLGVRYHVGGSIASSALGTPRSTLDVDLVAELRPQHVTQLLPLSAWFYLDEEAIRTAIDARRAFNLIHFDTALKIDVFVPEDHWFTDAEMARARTLATESGSCLRVKSPEDLILRKLLWYRHARETSERQWTDVLGVLRVQAATIDVTYLRESGARLGLDALLSRALQEAEIESSG